MVPEVVSGLGRLPGSPNLSAATAQEWTRQCWPSVRSLLTVMVLDANGRTEAFGKEGLGPDLIIGLLEGWKVIQVHFYE